ncbi:hypothetical protein AHF37_01357, partial [Paragonimus kellicotti]
LPNFSLVTRPGELPQCLGFRSTLGILDWRRHASYIVYAMKGHLASSCYAPSGSDSLGLVYSSSEAAVSDEEVSPSLGSIKKIKCLVGVVKKMQEDRKHSKKHSHEKEKKNKVGKHSRKERKRKHRRHRNDEPSCKKKRRSS